VCLVVGSLSVTHHSHDVGERHARAVVLVGVDEDSETLESVSRAEDRALGGALLGEPHSEAIAVQVALAVDLEFQLDLAPVSFLSIIYSWYPFLPANWSRSEARERRSILAAKVGRL
jgi:hypothetical protein